MRFPRAPLPAGFAGDTRGSAAIEFALLAIPFFLIVFAILEIALIFLAELTLDNAATEVGRQVRTGEVQSSKMSAADFRALVCGQVKVMLDCDKLVLDMRSYPAFADVPTRVPIRDDSVDTAGFGYDSGGSAKIVALRLYYKWPIITNVMRPYLAGTSDGASILVGSAVFRTEPF